MDERMKNLNLAEILKDCPKGTKLYSPIYGDVELVKIYDGCEYPIEVRLSDDMHDSYTKDGRINMDYDGECMLFPSKEQRDWSKFKVEKLKRPKFDPKTLQPFDKVLVRDNEEGQWVCSFYSHYREYGETLYRYMSTNNAYRYCIPYNDDTKHLVGTNEEAPEYYRYWED